LVCSAINGHAREAEVRVRLLRDLPTLTVTGYAVQVSLPSVFLVSEAQTGFHRVQIQSLGDHRWQVRWDRKKQTQEIHSESLWVRGQMLRAGALLQPPDFELWPSGRQRMDVIARLNLDDYLLGVLPAEMPISWPLEALKAQAIASRSYVLSEVHERAGERFDVDSTIQSQVYHFANEVYGRPVWWHKLSHALDDTRRELLLDTHNHILKAFFSADCGCQSEDPRFVWGQTDGYTSVHDPSCAQRLPSRWTVALDRQEVRGRLLAALDLPANSNLHSLQVAGRTPSGRVAQLRLATETDSGSRVSLLSAQEFRRIFGFQRVLSADFSLRWMANQLEIDGQGSGHGVGLCQRGSKTLAESGMNHREILKLYYPQAHLQQVHN
jgi:stage II sporulation protein D